MSRNSTLRERIDAALVEVTAAEGALETVLRELRAGTRAEKVTITTAVEAAFQRLRTARSDLAKLHELLEGDD